MEVRITFRSEIFIKGETLADCAKQWEQMELFSDEANQHEACQIELVSVEDAETFKDMLSEFNKIV
mgnify:FL=1